jgi:BNR/Asp-box repeat protein
MALIVRIAVVVVLGAWAFGVSAAAAGEHSARSSATRSPLWFGSERGRAVSHPSVKAPLAVAGCTNTFRRPGFPDNVRVNVDCSGIDQVEEWIAVNPADHRNVVVSHNDGVKVGMAYSLSGGVPSSFGETELATGIVQCDPSTALCGEAGLWSYDLFTDPSHAFARHGSLYFSAIGYDRFQDSANGIYVWRSPACSKGRVLANPTERTCPPSNDYLVPSTVHDNFANPENQDNKEWLAAGPRPARPDRTQLAVVWPILRFDCGAGGQLCEAAGFMSRSIDGGVSWTEAKEITGKAPFCVGGDEVTHDPRDAHACNLNEGMQDIIGPDGSIYVVWANFNTPSLVNQVLFRRSRDGGKTWSPVRRVGDLVTTEPVSVPGHRIPDCQDGDRCLPPNGYKLPVTLSVSINSATNELAVTWSDFRHGGPCRRLDDLTPVTPCQNANEDVFVATSKDRGHHWSRTKLVTRNTGVTAQWQPAGVAGDEPGELFVSYYDRSYGRCEKTGCNDITLATSHDHGATWTYRRITTSSMPNLRCTDRPNECGFLGDYQGLATTRGHVSLTWADTRGRGFNKPEEDVYFARVRTG